MIGEQINDLADGGAFVGRATDPNITPQPYASPADFAAQYPTPLDTTEIVAMCEEITMLQTLPTRPTALKQAIWRELNTLAFTSGSAYVSFADGECPEEYTHDGSNMTVTLKNMGAKKSLSLSDILHSQAVAGANWNGINRLLGAVPSNEGLPGVGGQASMALEVVADVKQKEIELAGALVLNQMNRLLIEGDSNGNSLEFDGFENWQANQSVSFHTNDNSSSGTFSAESFDRFLSEGCVKPSHVFGHPQAIQEMMSAYFQLGFQGSQVVNHSDGNRIVPGFNFASVVNTGVGAVTVVSDNNFERLNAGGGKFQASLWAMRMSHNGVPLVYREIQIPLSLKDLAPGCTAISFQLWEKSALVIKHACAHGQYTSQFTGRITSTCNTIY